MAIGYTEQRCAECGAILLLLDEVKESLCASCIWWRDEAYPTLETINQQTGAGLTVAQVRRAIEGE